MSVTFDPQAIEKSAQNYWDEQQSFVVKEDPNKEKFYCLSMLPYPSGQLHMGHVRNYTIGDVISRYQTMHGKNVLQPIGWDAFGLPAENAAIKHNRAPADWTYENIDYMRRQLKRLGFAYDWSREFTTCKPDYYRWEQWWFIKLYEKGLVYKKNSIVNWDPIDETVLANEQVVDGRGWRSGALVERREIAQWFLKITDYADELLDDIAKLEQWPDQVRTMQTNWIGRSEGIELTFDVENFSEPLTVFTTRPDTLFGVTYLAVAAQHPLAKHAAQDNAAIAKFIEACSHQKTAEADLATQEKLGIDTGFKAKHPLSGELVPVWIANFVLIEYGTGAVMAVPGHDERDHEFATKYQLPITQVIKPLDDKTECDVQKAALIEHGTVINSKQFDGLEFQAAFDAICAELVENNHGEKQTHFRLRDWGISRQRYWGTPVPMINCETCGTLPVPEDQLPVVLPEDVEFTGTKSPLQTLPEFFNTTCPKCDGAATRETDTFDTFVESSWYYARYTCPDQNNAMLDERAKYWTPVDFYIGGVEHAVMHLLYARFCHKTLRDLGLVDSDEPFKRLLTQGMVLKDGAKMSKSKGNTVDPQALIEQYGADTVRLFMMFAAPPEQSLEWSDSGVEGAHRFLKRFWEFATSIDLTAKTVDWQTANKDLQKARLNVHSILQQINFDYDRVQFNTVVSGCMKLLNVLKELPTANNGATDEYTLALQREGTSMLLRLLAPITPHLSHVLWLELGFGADVLTASWPSVDEQALETASISIVAQINGKLRANIDVPSDADNDSIEKIAREHPELQKHLADKTIRKVIVVPKRLVNIVVS